LEFVSAAKDNLRCYTAYLFDGTMTFAKAELVCWDSVVVS